MGKTDDQPPATDRFQWVTRIAQEVIDRFGQMEDLSSTVSDVLDEMGILGAVGASRHSRSRSAFGPRAIGGGLP